MLQDVPHLSKQRSRIASHDVCFQVSSTMGIFCICRKVRSGAFCKPGLRQLGSDKGRRSMEDDAPKWSELALLAAGKPRRKAPDWVKRIATSPLRN